MGYDLGNAALAGLSVLAVVFAAALFPAAGLGTYPGGVGGTAADDPGASDDGAPGTGEAGGSGVETTPPPDGSGDSGDSKSNAGSDGGDGERQTSTPDDAGAGSSDGSDDSGSDRSDSGSDYDGSSSDSESGGIAGLALMLLFGPLLLLGLMLAAGTAVGVVEPRRRDSGLVLEIGGYTLDVGGRLQGVSRATMGYVLGLSSATADLFDRLGGLATSLGDLSGSGPDSRGLLGTLAAIPRGVGRATRRAGSSIGGALLSVSSGTRKLFSIGSVGIGWSREEAPGEDARSVGDDATTATAADPDAPRRPPESVLEAYERFMGRVPVRNARARTPGEFARAAATRGYPTESVARLTRTFRAVRYGDYPESDRQVETAREALERIDGGDGDDDDGGQEGGD